MAYQALYRVWRPTDFRDVVGQEHITRTLQSIIAEQSCARLFVYGTSWNR